MLRILCVLLLFFFPVCGQVSSSPPTNAAAPAAHSTRYTAANTVAALHQMFRTRRAGGFTLIGLGIAAQVASPIVAVNLPIIYPNYEGIKYFAGGLVLRQAN